MSRKKKRCRQTLFAERRRLELLQKLAPTGECAECKSTTEPLHVDHVNGKQWDANKLSSSSRVVKYWREFDAGVPMQALCVSCNGKKNGRDHRQPYGDPHPPSVPPPPPAYEHFGGEYDGYPPC